MNLSAKQKKLPAVFWHIRCRDKGANQCGRIRRHDTLDCQFAL